ncbi:unnamed protein product [Spirodela intermedia]|uniref:HTH myb-type domain-containing protein n=1 Tax=Spirodela intermedia TaxID=51605 RepID=A0A7I8K5Y0_SPIIN|nr:unnamed protein product [Spirodela intermedia]
MYGHHEGKHGILTSRAAFHQDRHLLLQGANAPGDAGLVLSTDAKPRLKWTQDLHDRFIEAVNQLGGADKATPKTIMKLMGIPGLTLYHLKSHLQKYRLSKNLHTQANSATCKNASAGRPPEVSGTQTSTATPSPANKTLQIGEALQMQIEVQKRLHEQLEVQRHLQLRIEAQGKYLQSVLEKAQETLGKQNIGPAGLDAAKAQLSELVSEVSNECINSQIPGLREMAVFRGFQAQRHQLADCSMDSCLTSSEGAQKDREMQNIRMRLGTYNDDFTICTNHDGQNGLGHIQPSWTDTQNECKKLSSSVGKDAGRAMLPWKDAGDLSMGITIERLTESDRGVTVYNVKKKDREGEKLFHESKIMAFDQDREKPSGSFGQEDISAELDLNTQDKSAEAPNFKMFDLNGFSWS